VSSTRGNLAGYEREYQDPKKLTPSEKFRGALPVPRALPQLWRRIAIKPAPIRIRPKRR